MQGLQANGRCPSRIIFHKILNNQWLEWLVQCFSTGLLPKSVDITPLGQSGRGFAADGLVRQKTARVCI
ncbi:MAG: hypothetical protein GY734_10465 [Herbaspirillum sp.]|jgi:hypothetical protein|uniref:hypothetical protein n=1 Tax=Herbaspirillum sp. TaxID=1890675 RepID=UPI002584466C|nr:hypothetical protein [Herbaspirillum sp.]MCP3656412.1 hypothetical protein [Herbaspirillum sp.]MCP4031650.1 hypothetical protein [Herbaspirillum sp.]MCP4558048.1 hypothetical protein [Herbaspirillum sp.]